MQITRIGLPYQGETPSLVLPLVYDVSTNLTQLAEKRDPSPASAMAAASLQLKRFAEYGANQSECSLFPAVRDLLANLTLPSDPPVMSQVSTIFWNLQYICKSKNFIIIFILQIFIKYLND